MNGHTDVHEVDPFGIGVSFAQAYYDLLNQEPTAVCRFFAAHSSFTFSENDEVADVQIGPAEVKARLSDLQLQDVKTDVKSIDCQSSTKGSVLVVVHGILYSSHQVNVPWLESACLPALVSQVPKRFSQVFVLARTKSSRIARTVGLPSPPPNCSPSDPVLAIPGLHYAFMRNFCSQVG